MALKKNFFKGLQSGVNHSPLKFHDGTEGLHGLDKKKVKVEDERNVVAQDNLRTNRPIIKPTKIQIEKANAEDAVALRDSVNDKYKKSRLDAMKLKYPKASESELNSYLFSNKEGLPANFGNSQPGKGVPRLGFRGKAFTGPNIPSDALVVSNNYHTGSGSIDPYQYTINDPGDKDNILFGLNAEEKRAKIKENIENLNLDPRNKEDNYQYQSLNNFNDWYSDDITQQRLREQAQFSGNVRKPNVSVYNKDYENPFGIKGAEDVAGSLYSQADIDNTLSSITDKKFTFLNEERDGTMASVDPSDSTVDFDMFSKYYTQPTKFYKQTRGEIMNNRPLKPYGVDYEPGKPSRNELINIAPETVDISTINGGINDNTASFIDWRDKQLMQNPDKRPSARDYPSEFAQISSKAAGEHELLHSTRLDKAMDPYLRSILKRTDKQSRFGNYGYNSQEGELYANFHEFRRTLGMKPGEQFTDESLQKRIEEKKLNSINNDFIQNFTDESLLEALNNVADVDEKSKGKLQFDFLKSKDQNNSYEMNA
jgi:hypothetical protein